MAIPDISVIGTGGLGATLTRALVSRNITVKSVFNRTKEKAEKLAQSCQITTWDTFPTSVEQLGKLTFITVSDGAIAKVAQRIANLDADVSNHIFVHCSGNESADLLAPLKTQGASVASFHPLQTFTVHSKPEDFKGIYFSLQGDREAYPPLKEIAHILDANVLEVSEEQKSRLHLSATMASNYLVTLMDSAVQAGNYGELSPTEIKKALLPLVRTSLNNIGRQSSLEALTGAVKRGDVFTVKKHLQLLETSNELKELYCVLGLRTLELVESSERLDQETIDRMRKILS